MSTTKQAPQDLEKAPETHGISRRTVTRGMAWTAPVVLTSVTVPAFAASPAPCVQKVGTLVVDPETDLVTSVVFPGGIVGTVTYSTNGYEAELTPVDTGKKYTSTFDAGVPNYAYIMLRHVPRMDKGWWVALSITFNEPVSKLSLNLTDIDKDTGQWIDHVVVVGGTVDNEGDVTPVGFGHSFAVPPAAKSQPNGIPDPFLSGSGTDADPFKAVGDWSLTLDRNNGDAALTWPNDVKTVSVKFLAFDTTGASTSGQHIGVGNFTLGC